MNLPNNIQKEHLLSAIEKIDKEGIPPNAASQYYDVVYNEKRYPPKLVVSYANIFANGEALDRNSFPGGLDTKCFKLLEENGLAIVKKESQRNVWFVAQGSTFTPERGMKFLFAPSSGSDGNSRFYWENVLKVKKGDIIFNYSGELKGVSIAKSDGYEAKDDDANSRWSREGYRVDIDLTVLSPPIAREQMVDKKTQLNEYLQGVDRKPFNQSGGVNQGYLYEFSAEAGKFLRELYGKRFGNETIDDFFDDIELLEGLELNEPQRIAKNGIAFSYQNFHSKTQAANFHITQKLCLRFIASLLTKPFVILTGLSGSGKTKLAQAFAMWICEDENQYCIVPVGADWTNREPLLGFPNALETGKYIKPDNRVLDLIIEASRDANKPYFLILDEMNLSHVERYFADFLSVMETNGSIYLHAGNEPWNDVPAQITLPQNLFIIGTVNIDETTYMFSPKVLDRANVIEFRVSPGEMESYLESNERLNLDSLEFVGSDMGASFVKLSKDRAIAASNTEQLNQTLITFFKELKKTGAEFGYRSAAEILRFCAIVNHIESDWTMAEIIDAAIMQKLLPKVHGSRRRLEPVLKTLGRLCLEDAEKTMDYLSSKQETNSISEAKIKYPLSFEKLLRMHQALINNGFTSYAEA